MNGKVSLATLRLPGHRESVKNTNCRDDDAPESKLLPLIVRKYSDLVANNKAFRRTWRFFSTRSKTALHANLKIDRPAFTDTSTHSGLPCTESAALRKQRAENARSDRLHWAGSPRSWPVQKWTLPLPRAPDPVHADGWCH